VTSITIAAAVGCFASLVACTADTNSTEPEAASADLSAAHACPAREPRDGVDRCTTEWQQCRYRHPVDGSTDEFNCTHGVWVYNPGGGEHGGGE
jgi:hypothetical protein